MLGKQLVNDMAGEMVIGTRRFSLQNKTHVMGILNVTPDSFSDGGKWNSVDAALKHTEQMIMDGADMIDVGGESTRPGYVPAAQQEEIERVIPVIEKMKANFDIPISVDTCKSKVAKAAVLAGADMVNDIWGLKYDPDMAGVIAEAGAACCLMHNRLDMCYGDFMQDVADDLRGTLRTAKEAGILDDKIILDPGVGFAKSYENNLEVMRSIGQVRALGYPVLLGASRKSVIGLALGLPVTERLEGTLALSVYAAVQKCPFVRVHDVKENVRALRMVEAVLYG